MRQVALAKEISKMKDKTVLKIAAAGLMADGLIPPWQNSTDYNGDAGFRSSKPAGYPPIINATRPERPDPD